MATVTALLTYPVKGCAPTPLTRSTLLATGLPHDRSFMIVDPEGTLISQREVPSMALIRPAFDGDALVLTAPDAPEFHLVVTVDGPRVPVSMFKQAYKGVDQGDEIAAWLSAYLGTPARLVRVPPDHDRVTEGANHGTALFADDSAVLIISEESLADLNGRLAAPVPMDRFRPSVVVSGLGAFGEDRVRRVRVGTAELAYSELGKRCVVITVDQETGRKTGHEPTKTLATYRKPGKGGVCFGAHFVVAAEGELAVGDEVSVEEWGESEL
ncbi:molybdenum cofactor sulfurase [Actinorhabdospora filicis]|uniref:Molybdenum cofactor sulfurase n=1 Tax=Actinorhabdospora filicis TaxID=1785913 RepID=A0A9W6SPM9_9ACTN|nr:MOSC N-terminal beta barrel domain-containing protein [Actinorhabdospora filicis]GLZ79891.1 molybdenum cofactor sulfurase [Actinorhabdospora filicis]